MRLSRPRVAGFASEARVCANRIKFINCNTILRGIYEACLPGFDHHGNNMFSYRSLNRAMVKRLHDEQPDLHRLA